MPRLKTRRWDARQVYFLLCAANALFFGMVFTASMIYQVQVVGLSPLQLVLVGTTLEVTAFLFEVPTGIVADVYSRRLSILIGIVLIGFGFMLEGSVPRFEAILLAQVLWGVGYTFTSGATEAWIVDEVGGSNAGQVLLRGAQFGALGGVIGILASVTLGSIVINLPVVMGGVGLLALAVFLAFVMPETGFQPIPREDRGSWGTMAHTFREGLKLVRGRPILITIVGIALLYGMYSEGFDRLWTPHLLKDFTLPAIGDLQPIAWFGGIGIAGMILSALATEVIRRRVDARHSIAAARSLFVISSVMIAGLLGFALVENVLLALAALLVFNTARGLVGPIFSTWTNQHIDSTVRATVLSMFSQLDAIGQIAGGPFVGAVGNVSIRAALTFAALILSPVLLLFLRAVRQTRTAPSYPAVEEAASIG